jgi:hypothetical protein
LRYYYKEKIDYLKFMPQTLQDLYGANATLNGTTLTINLSDFTATGFDPTNAANRTPGKIGAAHLKYMREQNKGDVKTNDPTVGIAADEFSQGQKQFVVRGVEPNAQAQVLTQIVLNIYTPDEAADFDPDKVVG